MMVCRCTRRSGKRETKKCYKKNKKCSGTQGAPATFFSDPQIRSGPWAVSVQRTCGSLAASLVYLECRNDIDYAKYCVQRVLYCGSFAAF